MNVKEGQKIPDFTLPNQKGEKIKLSDYLGKWVLIYFYPKDHTPGCTIEACQLRDHYQEIKKNGIIVFGISVDSVKSHKKFSERFKLPFDLLADEDKEVVQDFGVWGKKNFMGRGFTSTSRSSVLIDPKGTIAKIYEKVKPAEHAEQVLKDVSKMTLQ